MHPGRAGRRTVDREFLLLSLSLSLSVCVCVLSRVSLTCARFCGHLNLHPFLSQVCTGKGTAVTNCQEVLGNETGTNSTGEQILGQLEQIPDAIQSPSSWIFTSNDECTPISDQAAVKNYYSALPVGATDAKDYWLFIQSTRGLVACFCGIGFATILALASHRPGRPGAAGCSHFLKSLQVSAGICAIGVFIGMLSGLSSSQDFVWNEFGEFPFSFFERSRGGRRG